MNEESIPTKKHKTPWRLGSEYKDGKYFEFDPRQILVMTAWPDPRAWRRTKTIDWKQVRMQANIISWWDMALPEKEIVEHLLTTNFGGEVRAPWGDMVEIQHHVNRHLLAQFTARLENLEDLFLPSFSWPEAINSDRKWDLLFEAKTLLVQYRWLCQIPLPIRTALQVFKDRRWQVLNLLARCPGAHDLCLSNPALAFALANNWCFHRPAVKQPYRAARALVRKKQRVIAGWLGFPPNNAAVRVLAKIQPEGLSMKRFLYFKEAMKDPVVFELLAHLPTIDAAVMELMNSRMLRPRLSYALLREVCELEKNLTGLLPPDKNADTDGLRWLIGLICDVVGLMKNPRCRERWPDQFRSIAHLKEFHDLAAMRLYANPDLQLQMILAENIAFPPPPFPGSADIQPIATPQDLFDEGRRMHHCIGSYIDRVRYGGFYAYRVMSPIRATLAIRQNPEREWVADQSVTFANEPIAELDRESLYSALFASSVAQSASLSDTSRRANEDTNIFLGR
jgi:hypothetical protein